MQHYNDFPSKLMLYVPRGLLLQGKARQSLQTIFAAILHARHQGCSLFQEKIIRVLSCPIAVTGVKRRTHYRIAQGQDLTTMGTHLALTHSKIMQHKKSLLVVEEVKSKQTNQFIHLSSVWLLQLNSSIILSVFSFIFVSYMAWEIMDFCNTLRP